MWGQWEGELRLTDRRWHCTLNIDRDRSSRGRLLLYDLDEYETWSHGVLTTIRVDDAGLDGARLSAALSFEPYPVKAAVSEQRPSLLGEASGFAGVARGFDIDATFDIRGEQATLHLRDIQNGDAISAKRMSSWNDYKAWVGGLNTDGRTFRGHADSEFMLRSAFHRRDRRDLLRFEIEDLPPLRSQLQAHLNRKFDLNDPDDFANLLSIGQHHGFPTPLLDWTESPYIAAYFALRERRQTVSGYCRVFSVNAGVLKGRVTAENTTLSSPFLTFHCESAARLHNARASAQQSVLAVTNTADAGAYLTAVQRLLREKVIEAVDIPLGEAGAALADLRLMGLTEASLFPGLDGICRDLRERYF